jgi:hypothetical protein
MNSFCQMRDLGVRRCIVAFDSSISSAPEEFKEGKAAMHRRTPKCPFYGTWALLVLCLVGCASRATSDYVPPSNQARQAVEQMLEAWRAGDVEKVELRLPGNGPRVQIFDQQRASGQKLSKFQVIREIEGKQDQPRQIAVKLTFGEEEEIEATYYVVGIDPLLVFRDTDYRQASGMN